MARCFLLVMDSFGIGHAPDAAAFGDEGANTYAHIRQGCSSGNADIPGVRSGALKLPFLQKLGLKQAVMLAAGKSPRALPGLQGQWGCASSISTGKDTISGHWEMTGLPVTFDWGYFSQRENSFPTELIEQLIKSAHLPGILGNCHASGTGIIAALGEEHISSGKPICYTSADSVFQIAAHEDHFGLDRLYDVCEIARQLLDPYNIGRVIARPFIGDSAATFSRTANRQDYAVPPTGKTLLDRVIDNGGAVHAVGKISDIFAGQGISYKLKASGHEELMAATIKAAQTAKDGDLIFTNFVDFDMLFGHQRDLPGYANALEEFDLLLQDFSTGLKPGDMVIITADHGNDPSWKGYDHTREQVPILIFGPDIKAGEFGARSSFSDIATTIGQHLGLAMTGNT
ncbi:MAG: phosphopentomutase [Proteobacteria bacterium]|nr:phosphopentomutase [Pseudomonadota bacterium]